VDEEQTYSTGRCASLLKELKRRPVVSAGIAALLLFVALCFIVGLRSNRYYAAVDKRFTYFTRFDQFIGIQCYTTSELDVSEVGKPGQLTLAEMTPVTPTKAERDRVKDEWNVYLSDGKRTL